MDMILLHRCRELQYKLGGCRTTQATYELNRRLLETLYPKLYFHFTREKK